MSRLLLKSGPLPGLVAVLLIFLVAGFTQPAFLDSFFSLYNAKTILTQTVIVGIGALGMTLVIVSGGIDLSVGSQIALSTVVIARILTALGGTAYAGPGIALVAALAAIVVSGLTGLVGGLVSTRLRVAPFIVTLGTMQVARGIAKWLAREQTVVSPPNVLQSLMLVDPEPGWMILAPGIWIMLLLAVLIYIVLRFTVLGRHIFALGSNESTARLCGVPVLSRRLLVYTLCGGITGLAGIMQYANLTVGDPTAASGMELDIIAAVVIGGGSLSGGEGSAAGSLAGALLITLLRNGCNMLGLPSYFQEIMIGCIIVGAVLIDRVRHTAAQRA